MSYTVENLEKSMAKLTITVSAEDFEAAMVKSFNKNKNSISIQGFRKGKAYLRTGHFHGQQAGSGTFGRRRGDGGTDSPFKEYRLRSCSGLLLCQAHA